MSAATPAKYSLGDVKHFWNKSQKDLLFVQATALAYTSIVSLIPVLAVAFFLFNAFGGFETLLDKIQPFIEQNLAPSFSDQVSKYINGFMANAHAGAVGTFGVLGFMVTAIMTLSKIEDTFNLIWEVRRQRTWIRRVTVYWSLLTIGPVLIALSMTLSSSALGWLKADTGEISRLLVWLFTLSPYVISGLLFTGLYLIMPNARVAFKDAAKAGFITGLVFETAKYFYAVYASDSIKNNSLYGSLAIIPVFLLWLYVVWLIVLFGAELCCYLQFKRLGLPYKFDIEFRLNPFVISDVLDELAQTQLEPKGGLTLAQLSSRLKVSIPELSIHMGFLEGEGWVVGTAGASEHTRRYHITVPMDRIDMSKIMGQLENLQYVPRSKRAANLYAETKRLWAQTVSQNQS